MDLSDFYGGRDVSWMDDAACGGIENPDIFFPPRDKALYKTVADEAKKYCFGENGKTHCPVRKDCLWYGISGDAQHGILGGLSHRERNAIVRKWQRQFKHQMSLKDYIYSIDKRANGNSKVGTR